MLTTTINKEINMDTIQLGNFVKDKWIGLTLITDSVKISFKETCMEVQVDDTVRVVLYTSPAEVKEDLF